MFGTIVKDIIREGLGFNEACAGPSSHGIQGLN
jgi:hypothetical protein